MLTKQQISNQYNMLRQITKETSIKHGAECSEWRDIGLVSHMVRKITSLQLAEPVSKHRMVMVNLGKKWHLVFLSHTLGELFLRQ